MLYAGQLELYMQGQEKSILEESELPLDSDDGIDHFFKNMIKLLFSSTKFCLVNCGIGLSQRQGQRLTKSNLLGRTLTNHFS